MKTRIWLTILGMVLGFGWSLAGEYELEPTHTYAYFKVDHLNRGSMTGVFTDVQGTLVLDEGTANDQQFEITVRVESLQTWDADRDKHLLGPDFFSAKRYRTMSFKTKSVEKVSDREYRLIGHLKIRGKTQPVVAKLIRGETGLDPWGGYRTGGNITLEIDRRDFGMKAVPEPAVGYKVTLDLYWEALRK